MQRKHLFISGRVQGVCFRAHAREKAESLGIRGWVRNLPDGRVEAVIEGDDSSIREMLEWCRTGNPPARVDHVEVIDEEERGHFINFKILR
ncbi:MAG: acylphosphatase [Peptococcaceae bacterium]|nr:acylphosphatase [Peptococcaceae bacterium]